MEKNYKKLFLCFVTFVLFMSTANLYSYLLEDTIYIEIKSDSISKDEIEDIKKELYDKFEKIGLSIDKSIKKATYKYRITINKNSVSITNQISKKSISKELNNKNKFVNYIYDYILKDSGYKYDPENFVEKDEENEQKEYDGLNENDLILSTGINIIKDYGYIKNTMFSIINLDVAFELYFIKLSFNLAVQPKIFDKYHSFYSSFAFQVSYILFYKSKISPYINIGFSIIEYEKSTGDDNTLKYEKNNILTDLARINGFLAIPFGIGLELFRDSRYRLFIESNIIMPISEVDSVQYESGTAKNIWSGYPITLTFSIKFGFSIYSKSQGCCACIF